MAPISTPFELPFELPTPSLHLVLPPSTGVIRTDKTPRLRPAPYQPARAKRSKSQIPDIAAASPTTPAPRNSRKVVLETAVSRNDCRTQDRPASSSDQSKKIPKPKGEFGKPNNGGYTIQTASQLEKERYEEIRDWVNGRVDHLLNMECTYTEQDPADLDRLRSEALKKFPLLEDYTDRWLLDDIIRSHIKSMRKNRKDSTKKETRKK